MMGRRATVPAVYQTIGRWIRSERQARGLSQEKLAERVGLSRYTIGCMEAGRQVICVHQLLAIQDGLDGGRARAHRDASRMKPA